MELLSPSPGLLFWQIVVFGLMVFLLWKFAWKGILDGLNEREGEITSALKMAEETRAEMAKLKSDNDNLKAEARKERDAIIKEAKEASDRMITEAKEKASAESARILQESRESLAQEKLAMMAQIKSEVSSLSIEIAEKVLRKELADKSTQQAFVNELISDAKLN